jgi:hypothetical protein
MENQIGIRSIGDILDYKFTIPRYQRGYRWTKQEIWELLDDILEFYQNGEKGDFYCLQPVVVKQNGDKWIVIDGQQRLTTIYVILSYLEEIRLSLYDKKATIYSIDFETREKCVPFLEEKKFKNHLNQTNIDFYHISKCYEYVDKWFAKRPTERYHILQTILNTDKKELRVCIIWYQINDDSDPIDIFERLNIGKIPLTNAELIKAMLLQGDKYPVESEDPMQRRLSKELIQKRLFEIATEWDQMELTLQNDWMWRFLVKADYNPSSRIELLFELLATQWNGGLPDGKNINAKAKNFDFLVFCAYLNNLRGSTQVHTIDSINRIWKEIKDYFEIFKEWYNNTELFHYIGYLLAYSNANHISSIVSLYRQNDKEAFTNELKKKIGKSLKFNKTDENGHIKTLKQYDYISDSKEIQKILLLFNIDSIIKQNKEQARFPFHRYKEEKIDSIEHIHPQHPEDIDYSDERSKTWLNSHIETLKRINQENCREYIDEMEALLNNYDKDHFKKLYDKVLTHLDSLSEIKESEVHTLYNLALVDKDTNSALNNSSFDRKRVILKKREEDGRYIPLCTRNVFNKYYSEMPKEMFFWGNDDRTAYFNAIEKTYNYYFNLYN